MDCDHARKRNVNPIAKANILSLLSFFYTIKLFIKGYTRGIETQDIYEILPNCSSRKLGNNLEKQWLKERYRNFSICRALWNSFGKIFLGLGLIQLMQTLIAIIWSPLALSKLIAYFSPDQTILSKQDAIFYACVVIGLEFFNLFIKENLSLGMGYLAIRVKAAISSLLYRKTLNLHSESLSEATTGKIVTIITKDLDAFEQFIFNGNNSWIAIIKTFVVCYLVYSKIGIASVPGIVFFFVALPVQVFIGKRVYGLRLNCSRKTDQRLELVREILSAIRIIKMYTWESFFEKKVKDARKAELDHLYKYYYTFIWIWVIGVVSWRIAFFLFLITYTWIGHNITAETVFYVLTCFTNLEMALSDDLPHAFTMAAEAYAAAKRTESVLQAEEPPPRQKEAKSEQPEIFFNGVNIKTHGNDVFENISLIIKDPLTIIVGQVGSGKTTFLKTILQEYQITGEAKISGKISYASQEPWLFPSTIRNNILFGEKYSQKRYRDVLRICCLDHDLDLLPERDRTVVGDRGINLSKGQQARVNLARAVYRDSDIYLFDDCLTSVDARVSDHIFNECICNFLGNKKRIFVTSNCDFTQKVDRILVVKNRSVQFQEKTDRIESPKNLKHETQKEEDLKYDEIADRTQIYHENKRSGRVPLKYYREYIAHGGGIAVFCLILVMVVGTQSIRSTSDKLFSKWITLEQNLTNLKEINGTGTKYDEVLFGERTHELNLYISTAILSLVLTLIHFSVFYHFGRAASRRMHGAMVRNVINSTMEFFDCHFIGNILTRFAKDCDTLDERIVFAIMNCTMVVFAAAGAIVLLTSVNYIFLLETFVLLIFACVLKEFCQPTGRNVERLHVIARGPINGHLNATLEGLTTIRAFNMQDVLKEEFDRHQDLFVSAYFMATTTFHALRFFTKLICTLFITVIILQFLFSDLVTSVGDVGLVITQSFAITNIISSGIENLAECENLMISVERLVEFTELEEEDKSGKVIIGWPKTGAISYQNVSLSYDAEEMLSNINFVIAPKEKIGLVGRTGAGKSSIVSTLFRLYEIKGKITVDGVDIKDVSLNWLRSNISVLPQDPYLFTGTIRENLDPLWQHQDQEIWRILDELRLTNLISVLNMKVDKGSTFSAGQKQLLCLARVVLRKTKIVILDEATANVDQETDILMNEIIQKYFSECTIIIITHRVLSVVECHKVLVLNDGRVDEFDDPEKLMQNKNSFLRSVVG